MLYNPDWRNNSIEYVTSDKPNQLVLKATMNKPSRGQFMGWQFYFGEKIEGRKAELSSFTKIIIRARATQATEAKLSLVTTNADAYATSISLTTEWQNIELAFSSLQKDAYLLLPRPYPGFMPLRFTTIGTTPFNKTAIEKLEITFGEGTTSTPISIEVESVRLEK